MPGETTENSSIGRQAKNKENASHGSATDHWSHSTAQHSTAQHSTARHSTAQHSTAQHSTAHMLATAQLTYGGVTAHRPELVNADTGISRTIEPVVQGDVIQHQACVSNVSQPATHTHQPELAI